MAACKFSLLLNEPAENVIEKAQKMVVSNGGQFNGDSSGGDFELSIFGSKIAGTYLISSGYMNIEITSKPFLIPCASLEGFLQMQLAGNK